jgi:squalene-hopene/tetraprenyl-beta-curcumene cyclase
MIFNLGNHKILKISVQTIKWHNNMKHIILSFMLLIMPGCFSGSSKPECRLTPENRILLEKIDASLSRASAYLVSKQSPDGTWRSETYGMFRDGVTLTPYIMSALFFMPEKEGQARQAYRNGVEYLLTLIGDDGKLKTDLLFPVLTAASASRMVVLETKDETHKQAQLAYLKIIRQWQMTEALGWMPDDPEYGGWGFSLHPPKKPAEGQLKAHFSESNMVATIFAIAAMRSARIPLDDPIWKKALIFVKRCQNFSDDPSLSDARFDDGGFYFIPNDALQNKAGIAGTDCFDRQRFHSYGTMTADGLRALLQCGLPKDHPRVIAARKWLENHFSVSENPGNFNSDREVLRNATYYYWVWAVAHAFDRAGIRQFEQENKAVFWAEKLAEELIARQKEDGSWVNSFTDAKEDDPLVATPWAASALDICRRTIACAK